MGVRVVVMAGVGVRSGSNWSPEKSQRSPRCTTTRFPSVWPGIGRTRRPAPISRSSAIGRAGAYGWKRKAVGQWLVRPAGRYSRRERSRVARRRSIPDIASAATSAPLFAAQPSDPKRSEGSREPKVLLVGAQLVENAALREELKRRGYRTATARSEPEALMRLASMTPDLVISQYGLGRSDGATFIQAIRALPGIVRIPVVLLDSIHVQSRQDAARAVGAAGYVIEPIETARFVTKLAKIASSVGDRRFTRYAGRLAARLTGQTRPCLATEIGRGGFFIATTGAIGERSETRCEVALPELHRNLSFVGEVLYRSDLQGVDRQGIGVRIREISPDDEAALIAYVALRARQA